MNVWITSHESVSRFPLLLSFFPEPQNLERKLVMYVFLAYADTIAIK